MGVVAGQTVTILEGAMLNSASAFQGLHLVALQAERRTLLTDGKGLLCRSSGVAHGTFQRSHRAMYAGPEQLGLGGAVRVVAGRAGLCFHRIIRVGFFERAAGLVVTSQTQSRLGFGQKVLLVGAVGAVAGLAAFLEQNLMHELFLEEFLLVTAIADPVTFRHQHGRGLWTVGVMT